MRAKQKEARAKLEALSLQTAVATRSLAAADLDLEQHAAVMVLANTREKLKASIDHWYGTCTLTFEVPAESRENALRIVLESYQKFATDWQTAV